ncbi:MAG: MFS transporter [Acidobacteria bacterium]|nr:MFS transporter [Acidobacteriota bacterium]
MSTPTVRPTNTNLQPTNARQWVIFFAVTLAILAYIDRVCISMAMPDMAKDLGLDKAQQGYIFSAFALAYAGFEIPGGWLGDYMGPRKVLMRIVIWWSAFTALTGAMWNFLSLWITRFLFGAGEAGCFPNLTKAFTTWLPPAERVRAQGIMWMFARWGGAFTPPLVILVFKYMSWRWAFVVFGALGTVWAYFFYRWFRDNPKDHPGVNAAELKLLGGADAMASGHGDVPWAKLAGSRTVWLLWLQYFLLSFPWYFYITWLPTYLKEGRGLDSNTAAQYAIFPLLFGGMGSFACGILSNKLAVWTGSVSMARRSVASIGFLGAAIMLVLSINTSDAFLAMILMGLASFCNDLIMPGAWGTCMDVGGKYAGTLSGSMNMMGNMAGFVAPTVGGWMLKSNGNNYEPFLYVMAGAYLLGTFCWPFIDPVTPMDQNEEAHA